MSTSTPSTRRRHDGVPLGLSHAEGAQRAEHPDAPVDGHAGDDERAKEVYVKLDDVESLGLYVRKQDWGGALKLAEDPNHALKRRDEAKFDEALYLPYAEWLAVHDRFDEALEAYRKSGREDAPARMVQQLTYNAVVESRFKDAAYYYWLLASETLRVAAKKDNLQKVMATYTEQLHRGRPALRLFPY